MKFGRKRVILAVALFSLVCVAALYVAQARYGICIMEGRVLSPEELRQRALLNLINLEIKNGKDIGNYHYRVGVANSVSEVDIKKILKKLYSSEKSIEESLELEMLVTGRTHERAKPYLAEQMKEPFVLVIYDTSYKSIERGTIYISSNIKEGVREQRKDKRNKLETIRYFLEKMEFFYNSLCGYSNYYYSIDSYSFTREPWDKKYTDDFLKEKRHKSFEKEIEFIEKINKASDKFKPPRFAAISNCGNILTEPHDMGMPTRHITWFR